MTPRPRGAAAPRPADVVAEGLRRDEDGWEDVRPGYGGIAWKPEYHKDAFRALWEHIHGEESWDDRQWVWIFSFEAMPPDRRCAAPPVAASPV